MVPVFNGAKYIGQCAGFLRAQRFEDFEVVFSVDVKSTDGSYEAAVSECSDNPLWKVVQQTDDLRLAGARNTGLRAAEGDSVWFCDVDDAPSPDLLSELHRLQVETGADFVVCGFVNTGPDGVVKDNPDGGWRSRVMNREEALQSIARDEFPVSTWTKLFRRSFLLDNDLFFEDSTAEDVVHTFRCLDKASVVCIYDRPLYAYRMTSGSITRTRENRNRRGLSELDAYRRADDLVGDGPGSDAIRRHNAQLRMRSSGHMDLKGFLEYQRSDEARSDNRTYFKGTPEGILYRYLPRTYYYTEQVYFKLVYKRRGSSGMRRLKK